jgi:cell division protein FtsQ
MNVRRSRSDRSNRRVAKAPSERRAGARRATVPFEENTDENAETATATSDDVDNDVRRNDEAEWTSNRTTQSYSLNALFRILGAGLLFFGVTVAVAFGAYRYSQTSPRFSVRFVEIDGLRRVTRESILERTGLQTGRNIFSIDTDSLSRAIISDRWVQEVKVERRLPATIRINVVEREAGALAMVGDTMLVVTRTGEPFKRFELKDPTDVPVITGVSVDEPGREPAVERRRIATGLEVLRHYERTTVSRNHPAQEVHLTPGGEIVLTIGKQGIALHLGTGPWAKKLAMAERVLGKLKGRKGSVSSIFLDNRAHPERVVVRMK